jgi:hypothetical protein
MNLFFGLSLYFCSGHFAVAPPYLATLPQRQSMPLLVQNRDLSGFAFIFLWPDFLSCAGSDWTFFTLILRFEA